MHAQPPACLESTQSVHRVLKALKNVLRVTLSLYKLSLTLIIKKLKMPKSTQFGPENTVVGMGELMRVSPMPHYVWEAGRTISRAGVGGADSGGY